MRHLDVALGLVGAPHTPAVHRHREEHELQHELAPQAKVPEVDGLHRVDGEPHRPAPRPLACGGPVRDERERDDGELRPRPRVDEVGHRDRVGEDGETQDPTGVVPGAFVEVSEAAVAAILEVPEQQAVHPEDQVARLQTGEHVLAARDEQREVRDERRIREVPVPDALAEQVDERDHDQRRAGPVEHPRRDVDAEQIHRVPRGVLRGRRIGARDHRCCDGRHRRRARRGSRRRVSSRRRRRRDTTSRRPTGAASLESSRVTSSAMSNRTGSMLAGRCARPRGRYRATRCLAL